jgi:hypothetical protein
MAIAQKLVIFVLLSVFFLFGCTTPGQPGSGAPATPAPENNDFALPESDCLGITAEKMQQACGSGPLVMRVEPIENGYECTYYAKAPEYVESGLGVVNGTFILGGVQAKLKYFTGSDMSEIKKAIMQVDKPEIVGDYPGGFYTLNKFNLSMPFEREVEQIGVWMQKDPLSIGLEGTDIDYFAYDLSSDNGCSKEELFALGDYVSGRTTALGGGTIVPPAGPGTKPPEPGTAPGKVCCEMIVATVEGVVETKDGTPVEKGMVVNFGDQFYVEEGGSLVIGIVCSDDPDNVRVIGVYEVSEITQVTVTEGPDGKPTVKRDPGVASVSVKQLPAFETDFQVSTPRLTCSVRG